MRPKLSLLLLVTVLGAADCAGSGTSAAAKGEPGTGTSQRPRGPKVLSLEVKAQPAADSRSEGVIEIVARIKPDFHINSNTPSTEFLIPTSVKFRANQALILGPTRYPEGIDKKFSFSEDKLSIYEGKVVIKVPYRRSPASEAGGVLLQGEFSYQACTNTACLPPRKDDFEVMIN